MDSWVSSADKINVTMLDISPRQFCAQLITDVRLPCESAFRDEAQETAIVDHQARNPGGNDHHAD
jgi:hypothetical protein